MEHKKLLKNHRGYLTIVSIGIIIIAAIVVALLINLFSGSMKSTESTSLSKSSFFLASSGLQIAKRDLVEYHKRCGDINGTTLYTNATLPNITGEYTVNCSTNIISTTLNGNIGTGNAYPITLQNIVTASSTLLNSLTAGDTTSITLSNPTEAQQFSLNNSMVKIDDEHILYDVKVGTLLLGLKRGVAGTISSSHSSGATISQGILNSGIVIIDNEAIEYDGISGYTLQNVKRGILGTTQDNHADNSIVNQNLCVLTAIAGSPDLSNVLGKRKVREVISSDMGVGSFPFNSALVAKGTVDLKDTATIKNLYVDPSDPDFPGSTILTGSIIDFMNNSNTKVGDGAGGEVIASQDGDMNADVVQNSNMFDTKTIYEYLFPASLATLKSDAIPVADLDTALNTPAYTNKVIMVPAQNLDTANTVITTANGVQPKILIVNGNLAISSHDITLTVGQSGKPIALIVDGDLKVTGKNTTFTLHGILYVTGKFEGVGVGSGASSGGPSDDNSSINIIGFVAVEGPQGAKFFNDTTLEKNNDYITQFIIGGSGFTPNYTLPHKLRELFN